MSEELPLALVDYTNERYENHPGAEARTNTPEAIITGLQRELAESEAREEALEGVIFEVRQEMERLKCRK